MLIKEDEWEFCNRCFDRYTVDELILEYQLISFILNMDNIEKSILIDEFMELEFILLKKGMERLIDNASLFRAKIESHLIS